MSARAKSVLVVDDGPLLRRKLCQMLTREGDFDICGEADNGGDAIEKAKQLRPDLIIMDLSMPVMNGLEAARVLRRSMPLTPIIMFSNYNDDFVEKEASMVGHMRRANSQKKRSRHSLSARGNDEVPHVLGGPEPRQCLEYPDGTNEGIPLRSISSRPD
jgi:chemotaxis response regulator CheB